MATPTTPSRWLQCGPRNRTALEIATRLALADNTLALNETLTIAGARVCSVLYFYSHIDRRMRAEVIASEVRVVRMRVSVRRSAIVADVESYVVQLATALGGARRDLW